MMSKTAQARWDKIPIKKRSDIMKRVRKGEKLSK